MIDRHKSLIVRLAENDSDVQAAQALRYKVFYGEMGARPSEGTAWSKLDVDPFDEICDHLVVVDENRARENEADGHPRVVGTYRLLRRSVALRHRGFYSELEYDLDRPKNYPGEVVELGRSCVDADYRARGAIQLLWRGIADYLVRHDIDVMFGCASFPGTNPECLRESLSYLHHNHLAPSALRPRALENRYVAMDTLPPAGFDREESFGRLPPLIKGYVRVGGFVGDGAVVDHQFNTTDICIIVEKHRIAGKYHRHYRPSGTP